MKQTIATQSIDEQRAGVEATERKCNFKKCVSTWRIKQQTFYLCVRVRINTFSLCLSMADVRLFRHLNLFRDVGLPQSVRNYQTISAGNFSLIIPSSLCSAAFRFIRMCHYSQLSHQLPDSVHTYHVFPYDL